MGVESKHIPEERTGRDKGAGAAAGEWGRASGEVRVDGEWAGGGAKGSEEG